MQVPPSRTKGWTGALACGNTVPALLRGMNVRSSFLPNFFGSVLVASCSTSPSAHLTDDIDRVNEALTDTVLSSADQLINKYEHLRTMACAEGRLLGDSVNLLYERASERMFALDEQLTGPALVDGDPVLLAFKEHGVGSQAFNSTLELYALMEQVTTDDSARVMIQKIAQPLRTAGDIATWYQRDFLQVPAPAITAMLEKTVADMGQAKRWCAASLLKPCNER